MVRANPGRRYLVGTVRDMYDGTVTYSDGTVKDEFVGLKLVKDEY